MLDLTKVRMAKGSQAAGFEELCVHLADAICQEPVRDRQRVHGAGGDGGVEAIVITESGRRIGIQSKYFRDNLASTQWTQIKESVRQAMLKHPDLSEYVVCVPRDRTPGQIATWNTLVTGWRFTYPGLVVTWMGQSEITGFLIQPQWCYLATYWIGVPEYSPTWLSQKIDQAISQLHRRFTPDLHNKTQAEKDLAVLLALPDALSEYQDLCRDLAVRTRDLTGTLSGPIENAPCALTVASDNVRVALRDVFDGMADGKLLAQDFRFASALNSLVQSARELAQTTREQERLSRELDPDTERCPIEQLVSIGSMARGILSSAMSVHRTFVTRQDALRRPLWLLTGDAGIGKSHLMATAAQQLLEQEAGAVLLLGEQFLEGRPLTQQITDLLGWEHRFADLLACLRAQSEASGRPSLILIDAINESPTRGLWFSHLHQLIQAIEASPGVHLVLSCREDWLPKCVSQQLIDSAFRVVHAGYDLDFETVVNAYFRGYNVSADVFPSFAPEFRNPLFLKTVCETYADRKLPDEPLSFVAVLDAWENRICEDIERAIDCRKSIATKAVERIVERMAAQHAAHIPVEDAESICIELFPDRTATGSLYSRLRSFGVIEEVVRDDGTYVRLQYERFYDVKVARAELQQFENVAAWSRFWCEQVLPHLDWWDVTSHARLFAYALLLPEIFNLELVECTFPEPDETGYSPRDIVWDTWLEALAWRQIPSTHARIRHLFAEWEQTGEPPVEVFNRLMNFAAIEGHPLNADFLHYMLSSKALVEREVFWTIQLGYEDLSEGKGELQRFVRWCDAAGPRCSDEQARLAANVLLWLTSTTNQKNRDRATDSAIRLLRGRSGPISRLVQRFWEVDDPYVKERLLAVVAALVPTLTGKDLQTLGSIVCEQFFGGNQVPPNLLQREYARFIAEYCIHQGVLFGELQARVRPPYHTVIPTIWSDAQVKTLEDDPIFATIRRSVQPEDRGHTYGDFGRYVMQSAVRNFTDPAAVNPDAESLFERYPREDAGVAKRFILQRVVELGWPDEKGELDRFERSIESNGRQRPPMERVSKKFQWIGLYEYLGYLSDHRKLRRSSDELVDFSSASELFLRDYDPALPFFPKMAGKGVLSAQMETAAYNPIPSMDGEASRAAWIASDFEDFSRYLHVNIDDEHRLVLSAHLSFDEPLPFGIGKKSVQHATQWVNLYSFIVPAENAMELGARLRERTFWGRGVELPKAYGGWVTEYPWHPMLDEVERECSSGDRFLTEADGLFHGTVCSVGGEATPFALPSPGVCREMSESPLGPLSAPEQTETGDFVIRARNGREVFFGSVGSSAVVAASYQEFMGWLGDRNWCLVWCVLSERSIQQDTELLAESHQSAVVVLRPFEKPVRILAKRNDWRKDENVDFQL
ncbi:hypothetical protein [Paraburkholderia caffeinilytica]|uniref:hypothetical protein n=1 Tax=Paraburkholderia caffeinilytica TaxID=1761016 RepID=UPI003DA026AB